MTNKIEMYNYLLNQNFYFALPGGPTFDCKSSKTKGGFRPSPLQPPFKNDTGALPLDPVGCTEFERNSYSGSFDISIARLF